MHWGAAVEAICKANQISVPMGVSAVLTRRTKGAATAASLSDSREDSIPEDAKGETEQLFTKIMARLVKWDRPRWKNIQAIQSRTARRQAERRYLKEARSALGLSQDGQ
jgi:hypothetical protein